MSKVELTDEIKNLVKDVVNKLYNNNSYEIKISSFNEKESEETVKPRNSSSLSNAELAKTIDHTLLKPEAMPDDIKKLCGEAVENNFASVCVNPCWVSLCNEYLNNTEVKVCTVIGFPLGVANTSTKKYETVDALKNGAIEIDMVINVGQLKAGNYNYVYNDIKSVADEAKKYNALCKVIIETCLLTNEEKIFACLIAKDAGTNFVKTSTGFNKGGATIEDVALMKYVVGSKVKVKASGGVRTREDTLSMIENGADRIGASAGIKIING